jgi:hypothetical protein
MGVVVVYVIHLACGYKLIRSQAIYRGQRVQGRCDPKVLTVSELLQMFDVISVRSECTDNVAETEAKRVNRARMPKCNNKQRSPGPQGMTVIKSVRRARGEEAGISKERLPRSEVKKEGRARGEEEE